MNANMLQSSLNNNIERFFFSSSACIYPTYRQEDSDNPSLKEEDAYPADPDDFYGWEKLYTEKMCEAYQRDYDLEVRVAPVSITSVVLRELMREEEKSHQQHFVVR